jgi:ABC-type cobalamin transport system permease subunit
VRNLLYCARYFSAGGFMDNVTLFFTVALMGFSLILFVISAITYKRVGTTRLLLVSAAFGIFFLKGLLLTLGLFFPDPIGEVFKASVALTILDFGIMAFLYLSVAKK